MITQTRHPASDDVSDFWQELPGQIQVAVRKVFHWERTDVMSTEEFRERVVARTERNITSAVHRKTTPAGVSFADWIAQIKNLEAWLVKIARRAAIDEARKVLHLRAKKGQQPVVAGFSGIVPSVELQESGSDVASAGTESWPAHIANDSGLPMWHFLHAESRPHDALEHFRLCEDCQAALQLINDHLLDFLAAASNRAISMRHVSVIRRLGLRAGAIQFLLYCRTYETADQATRDRLDHNLRVLGCRKQLQPASGDRSRRRPPHRMRSCDQLLGMWVYTSSLLVFLSRPNLGIDWRRSWGQLCPIVMTSLEPTLSNSLAVLLMADVHGHLTVLCKARGKRRTRSCDFDQTLTNGSESRSTKPTKPEVQRNPSVRT